MIVIAFCFVKTVNFVFTERIESVYYVSVLAVSTLGNCFWAVLPVNSITLHKIGTKGNTFSPLRKESEKKESEEEKQYLIRGTTMFAAAESNLYEFQMRRGVGNG